MAHHGVEADAHFFTFCTVDIVLTQNLVSNGVFAGFISAGHTLCIGADFSAVKQINALVNQFYHNQNWF